MQENDQNIAQILIIEDNPADQLLFQEGAQNCRQRVALQFFADGIEALKFLRAEGEYSHRIRPHAILLDLNLPMKDGRELLAEIKADRNLRDIPVIVISTSNSADDISNAYSLGASSYLVKPMDFRQYVGMVEGVVAYCYRFPALSPSA